MQNVVASREEISVRDSVICPKPRRLGLLNFGVNDHSARAFRWHLRLVLCLSVFFPFPSPLLWFIFIDLFCILLFLFSCSCQVEPCDSNSYGGSSPLDAILTKVLLLLFSIFEIGYYVWSIDLGLIVYYLVLCLLLNCLVCGFWFSGG